MCKAVFKKILTILLILVLIVLVWAYMVNDGMYMLRDFNKSQLELINEYAVYEVPFPEATIIESFEFEKDSGWLNTFFSHTKYIEAVLLVPNEYIDQVIPSKIRMYDKKIILDLSYGEYPEDMIDYGVWLPRTVVKWIDKTQRDIWYTVMKPEEEYTRVYVYVSKIGWNLYQV